MNPPSILDLVLLAAAFAGVVWAMAERAAAERARGELAQGRDAGETVKAQAALSAAAVADALVKRASESFEAQGALAQARLEAQLQPVAQTLAKFEAKVAEADAARAREAGGLKAQIEQLMTATAATQAEAQKLAVALRRGSGVKGHWGEEMLHNVLELAGLRPGEDFTEQVHVSGPDGARRPDVAVRLPGGGVFVIDSKCAIADYLAAQDAADEATREAAYQRHAASVKAYMLGLSAKAYWEQFDRAPDFVAMFIPGDAFLSAATERAPELFTQAMEKRVILVTPSSLFALCKAVVYGWRVEQQGVNAREIAALGRELHKRLGVMGGHVAGVGKALDAAVGKYNAFVGSLETQVMSQARRFEALRADHAGQALTPPAAVETPVRRLVKLAAETGDVEVEAADAQPADSLTLGRPTHTSAP